MSAERNLRRILVANAASSAIAAVAGAALSGPVGRLLDVPTAAVLLVAAGLVPWAIGVGRLARSGRRTLLRWAPWVSVGDALWVAASTALLVGGVVDAGGWWLVIPMAVAVGELGLAQALLWRSLNRRPAPSTALAV